MITRIETLRYKSLRNLDVRLDPFHILVGPNGTGKSGFLDAVALLGDVLQGGVVSAIRKRSPLIRTLTWMGQSRSFEVAVELRIPDERQSALKTSAFTTARYELAIGHNRRRELVILGETLWLKPTANDISPQQRQLFPAPPAPPEQLVFPEGKKSPTGWKKVVTKKPESGNDYFFAETTGWNNPFRLGPYRSALANLPEDEERFPVATWVRRVFVEGVQQLALNSEAMRRPSPPGSPSEFQADGSNLPWAIEHLKRQGGSRYKKWIAHVRTAIPDIVNVDTRVRREDRHRYLRVSYRTGLIAPSWAVSDGTLRLLALTLIPYLQASGRIYLIEEPENGIHPKGVEAVFQSLASAYESQVLCASHSTVLLSLAEPAHLLCFAKDEEGATDVVRGSEHPSLVDWRSNIDLGVLFASGVLG
jgi:predicted ATPase